MSGFGNKICSHNLLNSKFPIKSILVNFSNGSLIDNNAKYFNTPLYLY